MPLSSKVDATALLSDPTQRAPRWWMLVLIALIAGAVYLNSLPNKFAFDDCGIIERNHYVTDLEWTAIWSNNYWPSPEGPCDLLYRPLTIFSYLANHALAPAPRANHAGTISLMIHVKRSSGLVMSPNGTTVSNESAVGMGGLASKPTK